MSVMELPSVDMLKPSSDLEEKLVTIWLASRFSDWPVEKFAMVIWAPMPKLESGPSFRKTLSEESFATALPPPGRALPTVMLPAGPVFGAKKLSLTMMLPLLNENWALASWAWNKTAAAIAAGT